MDLALQQVQEMKHQMLQLQQWVDQSQQHLHDMQQPLGMWHSYYMQYFQDMRYSQDMRYFLSRQQFIKMLHSLEMMRSEIQQMQHTQQMQHSLYMQYVQHMQCYKQLVLNELNFYYGPGPMQGNSSPVKVKSASTSSVDQESCTSQEENGPTSDVQRDVNNERMRNSEAQDSIQGSVPYSTGQEGIASPVIANVLSTSTSDSCPSWEENSPFPDHQEDEAVNKSRDVSRHDILKICHALFKLQSMCTDLREKNSKLKHILSQEEDIESYLQKIQHQVQNNLQNPKAWTLF